MFLILNPANGPQDELENSFIGGQPKLPSHCRPKPCSLCESSQTFFFQVAFPASHPWSGYSLAVFACTACAGKGSLIPEMVQDLKGPISEPFLVSYQRNFQLIVFPTSDSERVQDYDEKIQYIPLTLSTIPDEYVIGQVGGSPQWIYGDERPSSIGDQPPIFLLQLFSYLEFGILNSASPQMSLNLAGEPEPSDDDFYSLFIGNALYLFGSEPSKGLVYALTQVG